MRLSKYHFLDINLKNITYVTHIAFANFWKCDKLWASGFFSWAMKPELTATLKLIVAIAVIVLMSVQLSEEKQPKVLKMSFPNFPYRKKPHNEKAIKAKKSSCEVHPECQEKFSGTLKPWKTSWSCVECSWNPLQVPLSTRTVSARVCL